MSVFFVNYVKRLTNRADELAPARDSCRALRHWPSHTKGDSQRSFEKKRRSAQSIFLSNPWCGSLAPQHRHSQGDPETRRFAEPGRRS